MTNTPPYPNSMPVTRLRSLMKSFNLLAWPPPLVSSMMLMRSAPFRPRGGGSGIPSHGVRNGIQGDQARPRPAPFHGVENQVDKVDVRIRDATRRRVREKVPFFSSFDAPVQR